VIIHIMTYERSTLVNSEKYIGLDVHQATISVAVMDSKGKVVMESILETKASTILEFFAGLRGTLSVTFEEGTWAAWLYDLLKPHVAKLVVCNPILSERQIAATQLFQGSYSVVSVIHRTEWVAAQQLR
jgi:hypothetical protein